MEPLDVASADWIKDYDPLFDLFDEDRQAEAAEADAFDAINMSDFSNLLFGLDWLDNELPVSYMTQPEAPTSVSAPVTPILTQIQSETTSSSSSAYSSMAPSPISATTLATTLTTTTSATTSVTTPITTSTSSDIGTKTKNNNKRRKTIKSKGTSLLAQPSPKTTAGVSKIKNNNNILANVVTNGVVVSSSCGVITTLPIQLSTMASAITTTPTTTTIAAKALKAKTTTPTRLMSKNVPILQLSRSACVPQHTPSVFVPAPTDTTTTATLLTYSNIDNLTRLGTTTLATAKLAKIATDSTLGGTPANIETIIPVTVERRTLSGPEQARRLCVSIEHDYAKKAR